MEKKDLISLNSEILDVVSIEELEQRLELSSAWLCSNCSEATHGFCCGSQWNAPGPQ